MSSLEPVMTSFRCGNLLNGAEIDKCHRGGDHDHFGNGRIARMDLGIYPCTEGIPCQTDFLHIELCKIGHCPAGIPFFSAALIIRHPDYGRHP